MIHLLIPLMTCQMITAILIEHLLKLTLSVMMMQKHLTMKRVEMFLLKLTLMMTFNPSLSKIESEISLEELV